jgi:large subunit ribosomal protein L17
MISFHLWLLNQEVFIMRHAKHSRRLGRRTSHRLAMLRNLTTSLFKHQRITTTHTRAKEVQKMAERIITMAKNSLDPKKSLAAKRQVFRYIRDEGATEELFNVIAPQYSGDGKSSEERRGGYTRIIQVAPRKGDGAPMVFLELV